VTYTYLALVGEVPVHVDVEAVGARLEAKDDPGNDDSWLRVRGLYLHQTTGYTVQNIERTKHQPELPKMEEYQEVRTTTECKTPGIKPSTENGT
jgi:hypothetical protein